MEIWRCDAVLDGGLRGGGREEEMRGSWEEVEGLKNVVFIDYHPYYLSRSTFDGFAAWLESCCFALLCFACLVEGMEGWMSRKHG
jgi:hypothetical protein